jgi:hypothetical protein
LSAAEHPGAKADDGSLFWQINGFAAASPEQLGKRPPAFAGGELPWFVLRLRDDTATAVDLDREFAMFQEAQKADRERLYGQARIAKTVAVIVALLLLVLLGVMAVRFIGVSNRSPQTQQPPNQ